MRRKPERDALKALCKQIADTIRVNQAGDRVAISVAAPFDGVIELLTRARAMSTNP